MSDDYPCNVYITPFCLTKMNEYAAVAQPNEIGGLVKIETQDNGDVIASDFHPFKQKATDVSFDIPDGEIEKFMAKMIKDGKEDEIELWNSIGHSHPPNMGAQMSSVDVSAIRRFAAEQDAFSLIISASSRADTKPGTKDLLMHYCCTVRGKKIMFKNIPVHLSTTRDRLDLAKEVASLVCKKFKDSVGVGDSTAIDAAALDFATNSVPGIWEHEVEELRAEAKEMVPKLITSRPPQIGWGYAPSFPPRLNAASWDYDDDNFGYVNRAPRNSKAPDEKFTQHERLVQMANGYDPQTGVRVGKRKQKKAQMLLATSAAGEPVSDLPSPAEEDFVPGDLVTITEEACNRLLVGCASATEVMELTDMVDTPERVDRITSDGYYVNGFAFAQSDLCGFAEEDYDEEQSAFAEYLSIEGEVV